jgi:hypothetical protein
MTEVLTVKMTPELKEALRGVAFTDGHSSSSRVVKEILESNPKVIAQKKKMKKSLVGK